MSTLFAASGTTTTTTQPATGAASRTEIDLRMRAPRDPHAMVFSRTDALALGQSLQLISDQAPLPLRHQLDDRALGQFAWAALESGPTVWRVLITRVGVKPDRAAAGSCCAGGACCG